MALPARTRSCRQPTITCERGPSPNSHTVYTDATADLTHAVTEFFDHVYVMDDNPQRRAARLGLLATITELGEHTLAWEHLHT
ncbi:MAG: DALR anticodon-binding domain-containing protein [Pseudonocardiaceae bacterium]